MAKAVPIRDLTGRYLLDSGSRYVILTDPVATPCEITLPTATLVDTTITGYGGVWTDGTLAYQYQSAPTPDPDEIDIEDVPGGDTIDYELGPGDDGRSFRLRVTATNAFGSTIVYSDWTGQTADRNKIKRFTLLST